MIWIWPLSQRKKCLKEHQNCEKEYSAHKAAYEMLKLRGFGKTIPAILLLQHVLFCKQRSQHFLKEVRKQRR
jgi:hypothetical protein